VTRLQPSILDSSSPEFPQVTLRQAVGTPPYFTDRFTMASVSRQHQTDTGMKTLVTKLAQTSLCAT